MADRPGNERSNAVCTIIEDEDKVTDGWGLEVLPNASGFLQNNIRNSKNEARRFEALHHRTPGSSGSCKILCVRMRTAQELVASRTAVPGSEMC